MYILQFFNLKPIYAEETSAEPSPFTRLKQSFPTGATHELISTATAVAFKHYNIFAYRSFGNNIDFLNTVFC